MEKFDIRLSKLIIIALVGTRRVLQNSIKKPINISKNLEKPAIKQEITSILAKS